jgi:wyosine [tRNA(Phe)-imidazoG37] synthetase (radical SAM superfamily)
MIINEIQQYDNLYHGLYENVFDVFRIILSIAKNNLFLWIIMMTKTITLRETLEGGMSQEDPAISFGPVPSRRLGRSLGINNIPPKRCSYSCVYCQLGRTREMTVTRSNFYEPERVFEDVRNRVEKLGRESIDFLAFVPDGEPTLDKQLGEEINLLSGLGLPVGVITNSSLIWKAEVREALMGADWVSLKVDAFSSEVWKRIDRPHGRLDLQSIVEGMKTFSEEFEGFLCTETMLVEGMNDTKDEMEGIASIIEDIGPERAYLTLPLRPPAEGWASPPGEASVAMALEIMLRRGIRAEVLSTLIDGEFSLAGDLRGEILRITSVHPIDRKSMMELLRKAGSDPEIVDEMVEKGDLLLLEVNGRLFYRRHLETRTRKK